MPSRDRRVLTRWGAALPNSLRPTASIYLPECELAAMTLPDLHSGRPLLDRPSPVTGRFRKRPSDITATRWWANGDHPDDHVGWDEFDPIDGTVYKRLEGAVVGFYRHPDVPGGRECSHCGHVMHEHGWIETLEGGHIVCPGDWVVTGVKGERYPVKSDIFELTYEPVVE